MSDPLDPPAQKLVQRPRRLARDAQHPAPAPASTPPEPTDEEDDLEPIREPEPIGELHFSKTAAHAPKFPSPKKLETLEDIYATFREIGGGVYRLRVVRTVPKNWGGQLIAGHLGYIDEQISMDDFAERFGGGRYEIGVIGPTGSADETGMQPTRQITSIEVGIPGLPNIYSAGEDPMQQPRPGYAIPMQEHPTVQKTRLDHEYKDREREREMLVRANTTPEHVVTSIKEMSSAAIADIKDATAASNAILREQNIEYLKQLGLKEVELKELRNQSVELRAKADSAARESEVKTEKQMRETNEGLVKTLVEAHRKEIETLKEQARATTDALKTTHAAELTHIRDENRKDLDNASRRYADDIVRRDSDAKTAREGQKEQNDNRVNDLRASYDREIAQLKDQRDKALESMRTQYDTTKEMTKQGADQRVNLAERETERLRVLVEKLEKDLERVRKENTKSPMEFLQEAEAVSRGMLGMVRADEVETGSKEEEFDWKKEAAKAAISAASKIPEAVERAATSIAQVRERNAQVHAEAQQQQQQRLPSLGGGTGGGTGGGARRARRAPPPEPWMDANGVPPPYGGPVVGAEVPLQPMYAPLKVEPMPGFATAAPVQPVAAQVAPAPAAAMPVNGQVPTPPSEQAAPLTPEREEQLQDGYLQFVEELEKHIRGKMTPPVLFAQQFVAAVGVEQTIMFLKQNSADGFLKHIEASLPEGKSTPILTRDGRAYVKLLWIEVVKIVSAGQAVEEGVQA